MDKRSLSQRDIYTKFITPALRREGWDEMLQIREEVSFTKGRIIVRGKLVTRGRGKRADYVLYYKPNMPVAVIEAKDNSHAVADGPQQALGYAESRNEYSLVACWRAVCADAKLGRLRLHDLRHTAASQAIMSGEVMPLVGKLLGHRRHRTTEGYAHLADDHLVEAAEKVGIIIAEAMRSATPQPKFGTSRPAYDKTVILRDGASRPAHLADLPTQ